MDKKLAFLAFLTVMTISGILITPYENFMQRYMLAGFGLGFLALVAAWIGIDTARFFTFKSSFGKATLLISFGVLSWGLGNIAFFVYNAFLNVEVPYPSLADVGYLGMIPLANYGLFILLKSIRFRLDAKTFAKIIIPPIAVLTLLFPVFIYGKLAEEAPLMTKFLNVVYPLGDVLFLSLAFVILTLSYGSTLFKSLSILSLGFIVEALADFAFSYTTAAGLYYTGYWTDTLFCLAFFIIGVGLHYFKSSHDMILKKKK